MNLLSYIKQSTRIFRPLGIKSLKTPQQYDVFTYKSTLYLHSPFVQTVYGVFIQKKIGIEYQRERIYFKDGGHVALDWSKKIDPELAPPILFIMHGLTGSSEKNYMKALVQLASQEGYQCVCLNSRGINTEMTSPMPFTGIGHEELDAAIDRVQKYYPLSNIYLVGVSFGGNYLIRYLIKHRRFSIKGLVALAPPFNVKQVVDQMPLIYQKFFVWSYVYSTVSKHREMEYWQKIGLVKMKEVKKSKNLRDFYSSLTIKILGQNSVDQFLDSYSINGQMIANLNIDTLLMAAKDDPIVSYRAMPHKQIQQNKKIKFIVTDHGSHLCWFQGLKPKRWYPKPILNYLRNLRASIQND